MTASAIDMSNPTGWIKMMAGGRPNPAWVPGAGLARLARIGGGRAGDAYLPGSPPGVIGAARRSAGLTRRRLAQMLAVSQETVRSWEADTSPLFCVPYEQLRALVHALDEAGARVGWELDEILIAAQCDLLIPGMLHGFEDYAEVPPIEEATPEGWAARGLLRWALTGKVPLRYRPHVGSGKLLAEPDTARVAATAGELKLNLADLPLAAFGAALLTLAGG